jgi:hypothetical protein
LDSRGIPRAGILYLLSSIYLEETLASSIKTRHPAKGERKNKEREDPSPS